MWVGEHTAHDGKTNVYLHLLGYHLSDLGDTVIDSLSIWCKNLSGGI